MFVAYFPVGIVPNKVCLPLKQSFDIIDNHMEWLDNNLKSDYTICGIDWHFVNEEDAILFALKYQ